MMTLLGITLITIGVAGMIFSSHKIEQEKSNRYRRKTVRQGTSEIKLLDHSRPFLVGRIIH